VSGLASKPLGQFSLVWPQNQWRRFLPVWPQNWRSVPWLSLKPRWWRVSQFGPQNRQQWFGDLGHKITVTVSWFGPQNQADFSLSVVPQNRWRDVGAGHTSRSSSLLGIEASLARVSQSGLKTGGGATTGGARGTITEVASEAS
jgi:hypothetical protein